VLADWQLAVVFLTWVLGFIRRIVHQTSDFAPAALVGTSILRFFLVSWAEIVWPGSGMTGLLQSGDRSRWMNGSDLPRLQQKHGLSWVWGMRVVCWEWETHRLEPKRVGKSGSWASSMVMRVQELGSVLL
jgi:hypothetical protein